jgi:TetR/AcrR family transcriptional regulator, transcriptional repressor of bet genes
VPRVVDPEQRRAALAAAAIRVIAESGLEGTKLRDVASEAGWTTGALTHYFSDKRALLKLAMESSLEHLHSRHLADIAVRGDALSVVLEQALPLDEDRLRHWKVTLALTTQSWTDPELAQIKRRAYRRWRRSIAAAVADGIADGRYSPDLDLETTADELVALVDGVALQALFDPERWPASKQLSFLNRHVAGLKPRPD